MSRALNDLHPTFRPAAFELLARVAEGGIPCMIITTSRTQAEQAACVARGVSWTLNSKHLVGLAIDICPFDIYNLHGPDTLEWDGDDPVWEKLGAIATKHLPILKWGVVFRNGRRGDLGHFEWPTWEHTKET